MNLHFYIPGKLNCQNRCLSIYFFNAIKNWQKKNSTNKLCLKWISNLEKRSFFILVLKEVCSNLFLFSNESVIDEGLIQAPQLLLIVWKFRAATCTYGLRCISQLRIFFIWNFTRRLIGPRLRGEIASL